MTVLDRVTLYDVEDRLRGELGVDAVELRRDYSGRGMAGRHCVGFACDDAGDVRVALAHLTHDDNPELAAAAAVLAETPAEDAMGMGAIVYWPWVAAA
jgi:hypothetical protein